MDGAPGRGAVMHWSAAAIMSGLAYAFWAVLLRAGTAQYGWRVILLTAAMTEAVAIVFIAMPGLVEAPLRAVGYGIGAGLCAAVGYTLLLYSMGSVKSTMPVVLMSLYPALAVTLAWLFLGEDMRWDRWLGIGLAVLAGWLVVR